MGLWGFAHVWMYEEIQRDDLRSLITDLRRKGFQVESINDQRHTNSRIH